MALKLIEFSDHEFLHAVDDAMGDAPDVTAAVVQITLQLETDKPEQNIGSRLASMRRFGLVDYQPDGTPRRWYITALGRALLKGQLRNSQEAAFNRVTAGQTLLAVRELSRLALGDPNVAVVMNREWRHQWYNNPNRPRRAS